MAWNKENASKVRPGTKILLILFSQQKCLIFVASFLRPGTKRLPDFVKQERKKCKILYLKKWRESQFCEIRNKENIKKLVGFGLGKIDRSVIASLS
jgi:hypothetical protein